MPNETAKLTVYTLGQSGVILDQQPLEPSLPIDALVTAQNISHDPKAGHGGGLRNRDGLAKFNTVAMGGPVLGGIPMVTIGSGGAPAITITPGTTPPGGTGPGGGGPLDPTTGTPLIPLFPTTPGTRALIIGRRKNTADVVTDDGWFVTTAGLASTPVKVATVAPGQAHRSVPRSVAAGGNWSAAPAFAIIDGYLYYPAWQQWTVPSFSTSYIGGPSGVIRSGVNINVGVIVPSIHRTNGIVDEAVCVITKHPALQDNYYDFTPGNPSAPWNSGYSYGYYAISGPQRGDNMQPTIVSMVSANNNTIFFSVIDVGAAAGAELDVVPAGYDVARMFRYTLGDHSVVEVPLVAGPIDTTTFNLLPYALSWWNDRLWFGGYTFGGGTAIVYSMNPNVDYPTVRLSLPSEFRTTTLCPYNGFMFAGFQNRTGTPTAAAIYRFSADAAEAPTAFATIGGGTPVDSNGYVSMVEFNGGFYASYVNPTQASIIFKWDEPSGTFVSAYSSATDYMLTLAVDGSLLYAYGIAYSSGAILMLTTTDGVTWTDKTTAMAAGGAGPASHFMTPILFGWDA